jgi:hypothetical protein
MAVAGEVVSVAPSQFISTGSGTFSASSTMVATGMGAPP